MTNRKAGRLALLLASTVLGTGLANAQTATSPEQGGSPQPASPSRKIVSDQVTTGTATSNSPTPGAAEIIVTGSRIISSGIKAPTPVTVVSTAELLKKAPESISAGLYTLPQFKMTSGTSVTSAQAGTPSAGNYLNLRGLGAIETLVLVNGQRLPPTSFAGTVDANIIPQALIQRVDVVTGGASAAYGSDAVAGVVNFILDTKFNGIKGSAQYGLSSRADDHQTKFNIAVGHTYLDGRLHLEASFDYFNQPGISNNGARPYGGNYTGGWVETGNGTQANPYTPVYNVRIANGTYGTLILSGQNAAGGATPFTLNGYTFGPGGTYYKADLGTPTGTANFNVGGRDTAVAFGTTLTSALTTKQGFARADYDFGSDLHGFLQGSYTSSDNRYVTVGAGTQLGSFRIFSDNAFLPADVSNAMIAQGVSSFVAGRVEADQQPKTAYTNNQSWTVLGGLDGKLKNFKWNLNFSQGESILNMRHEGNFDQSKWFAALDAVRGPGGNIVCRITLTNPGLQDNCVPWNPFGNGSPSAASYAYFQTESRYRVKNVQSDIAASISGALFDLPAGAVNLALGGEYRHQSLDQTSNANPSVPIDLTGLRTYASTYNLTFNSTNVGKSHGAQSVKEAFAELAIPVLHDKAFFKSLDLSAAARYTDYSVSGGIWAWKGGFSWAPVQQLRFRGTYSQDIRAPTLYELFAGTSSVRGTFADIHTGVNTNTITLSHGNPNLKAEMARTLTIGGVWQPEFLPRFSASLDYYHIKIKNQITSLTINDINQRCEDSGGTDPLCQYINRPGAFSDHSAANFPISISSVPFNQANLVTEGFDYELNYRIPMKPLFFEDASRIDLRLIGNYTPKLTTQSAPTAAPVQNAGVAAGNYGVPRHKFTASFQFTEGPLSFGLDVRYLGTMFYSLVPTQYYTNNRLAPVAYLGANVSYDFKVKGHQLTAFLTGNNLTDKFVLAPQVNAQPTEFYPSFQSQYDVVGAYFVGGIRFKI
jgi:iron complex outermembrane recepter protein